MNPWEAELEIELSSRRLDTAERWLYAGADNAIACVPPDAIGGPDPWAKFFQAAPKMARALLACGYQHHTLRDREEWHTHACWETLAGEPCMSSCLATQEALRAAGVRIP